MVTDFRGERFLCFLGVLFEALSWHVGSFILGSNVCNSRFISFVGGGGVFLPSAVCKGSYAMSLSSPDFKPFNGVLCTVCIVLPILQFDYANSGLLVSYSKFHFAEKFLNSSKVNSGPLSKKTSWYSISCEHCFNFLYHYWWSVVEEFADLKILDVRVYNNEVGSPLYFE